MYLNLITDKVYRTLKEYGALSECAIIKAFPYAKKPTRLTRTVITVSPGGALLNNTALGEECAFGEFSVNINIFTPQEQGSPADNGTLDTVTQALLPLEPIRIKTGGFDGNDMLGAFEAQCTAVFSDILSTEDNSNEGN